MTNRLARESSPYLRQHADNPVDWWPWCAEALALARKTDRPILLSIGYAACHWCHVMAHESFEDAGTAALMNEHFVNVKVDREERPDLDAIYMQAVQAITGSGGWPMTVFLTPEGAPFFGGTYFPPADRHGMPSFRRVITSVADAWRTRRAEVLRSAGQVMATYEGGDGTGAGGNVPGSLDASTLDAAFASLARTRDPRFAGFGGAPKFPHAMALDFCLRHWARTGDSRALEIVRDTFLAMARGGIYDQVGGGFHRYSTDARWLVPHFEKMLYDNALLVRLGAHLWQATGDAEVRRITEETLAWACREMRTEEGGFCSSLDADSEGEEGRFYTWTAGELRKILGADYDSCAAAWGVSEGGNFEGRNILHVVHGADAPAAGHSRVRAGAREATGKGAGMEPASGQAGVAARARQVLLAVRERRVRPARDDKVIASWNGLMIRALAEAGRVFGDERWRRATLEAAAFVENRLMRDGRLMRSWRGTTSSVGGFLDDHAAMGLAYVGLYQMTFDRRWLDRARLFATACIERFGAEKPAAFHDTANDHEALIARPREVEDNATPSGNSLAAELLLMMAEYFDDEPARERAEAALAAAHDVMLEMPVMAGHALCATDMAVHGATEVAVAGAPASAATQALLAVVTTRYIPSLVLAAGTGDAVRGLPLFEGRQPAEATAYVCRRYACEAPAGDAATLALQIDAHRRTAR